MSLIYTPDFYSNELYYRPRTDTLAVSQARQTASFVEELIKHHWLSSRDAADRSVEAPEPVSVIAMTPVITLEPRVKDQGNLLRLTKTRALRKLRSIA